MEYRCEATSVAGFVQQLAVSYVGRGYFFYVIGEIPERKDPRVIDQRLIEKYGLGIGKATRARRKSAGSRQHPIPPITAARSCSLRPREDIHSSIGRAAWSAMHGRCRSSSADTPSAIEMATRTCGLSRRGI